MLPGLSGLEVCRALRGDKATEAIPIIMVTARAEETDRIVGLEIGADDYLAKPFSPNELVADICSGWQIDGADGSVVLRVRHRACCQPG